MTAAIPFAHSGVGWYRRRVADLANTVAFYRDIIGLPLIAGSVERGSVEFWLGEHTVLQLLAGGAPAKGYTDRSQALCAFHLRAHPVANVLDRARAAGAPVINDFQRDVNRLVYVLDPGGGVLGLNERYPNSPRPEDAEARRRRESGGTRIAGWPALPADAGPVGYYIIRVSDVDKVSAFYRDVCGFVERTRGAENCLLGIDSVTLLEVALGCPPPPVPSDPSEVSDAFFLRVDDVAAAVAGLRDAGCRLVGSIQNDQAGREAYVLDPENHLVGLRQA